MVTHAGAIARLLLSAAFAVGGIRAYRVMSRKNVDRIARAAVARRREPHRGTVHLFVCVADHFEPFWLDATRDVALSRVRRWLEHYPRAVDGIRDNGGTAPRHTFFYPQEEYDAECIDMLAQLTRSGLADVEVHLHHDHDTAEGLRAKLTQFTDVLHRRHGLLHTDQRTNRPAFAFIHGNWALDNSDPRGRYCGVNGELRVLAEAGCYADFTYPSAPHPTQPPVMNTIYYATDDPGDSRAHWKGIDAAYGRAGDGTLLLVTGPLCVNWRRRHRLIPTIENGDITDLNPAVPSRVDAWVRTGVHVRGFPRWRFIKTYTHGSQESNAELLLSGRPGSLSSMYRDLLARYNDGQRYVVHFSTPWEMVCAIRALEAGDERTIDAIERFEHRFV
ncbi:MAG TPA: hypothetical protein VFU38_06210 [Candidatus Krumholzibacteria bacterium]|nr:hypothetical protein [Candidatus Krumholzibacteria bacterium]